MNWIQFKYGDPLPQEKRFVLVHVDKDESNPASVVVGYLKFAGGDKDCPYFVCPGLARTFTVVFYCDCLGDDFHAPLWAGKQVPAVD